MGALKVNGDIISTSTIKVDNSNSSGYVRLAEDGEGGTIQVVGKNGTYTWEMDSYNNKDFRIFTKGSGSFKFFTFSGDTGNLTATSFTGSLSGNASTASKWQTARTITIGNTGKNVDGSENVSWTLSEIGAIPKSGGTMTGDLNFATIGSWPVVSGETYPIDSKGVWWSGSSDTAGIFYRITGGDSGNQVFYLGDDTSPNWIFTYSNGTVAATIHNGGITASNFIGNTNGYTWDLATHNTADTWLFVLNGSKIQHRLATDFCAASGSVNYVKVANSNNVGGSGSFTLNDLAKTGFAAGMIQSSVDNPTGSTKWVHALSMCWSEGSNTDWISQLAFGVQDSNGLWYRTNQSACVGKPWKRVLDSSNYNSYSPTLTGGGASGTWDINISGASATSALVYNGTAWGGYYADGDTHILQLGYFQVSSEYQSWVLCISSSFWGNQHSSSDFITVQSDTNGGFGYSASRVKIGGKTKRTFYLYKNATNNRLYLYVAAYGGNSYGYWDVSLLNSRYVNSWVGTAQFNTTLPSGSIEISEESFKPHTPSFGANQPSGSAQIGTLYYQTIG